MIFSRIFLSHSAGKNEEESFSVSFNLGYGNNLCIRGVCDDNLSKNFYVALCRKRCRGIFNVLLISVIEKFYALEG